MGQSLVKNFVHIAFSTKNRDPLITPVFEKELHTYLAGVCQELDCFPVEVGGYTDHIHILCNLSRKIALMKVLETVKSHSSKWVKMIQPDLTNFYWQDGYGAFSVTPSELDKVAEYIRKQHVHHSKKTFQGEYRQLLKKYDVDYDERYVWL